MCYAIPGRVKEIRDNIAIVDYFGEEKKAHNEMRNLQIGDYIYAQGGFVIKKIKENEALEILAAWKEMFFALKEVDTQLSRIDRKDIKVGDKLSRILDKAMDGRGIIKEEALFLLNCAKDDELALIFKTANFLRQKYKIKFTDIYKEIKPRNTT